MRHEISYSEKILQQLRLQAVNAHQQLQLERDDDSIACSEADEKGDNEADAIENNNMNDQVVDGNDDVTKAACVKFICCQQ